jgi:putative DNA primase/helicase
MPQILNDFHRQQLTQGSGIALAIIAERGYRSLDHPDDVQDLGFSKAQARTAPVLAIPLWDVHGQQTGWQIRPDSPRQFKDGKVPKYEQPKGSRLILDVHPRVQPRLGDPQEPLWLTEGVKKGDALASHGVCAIALNGVWGFKGSNEHGGKVILPDWAHVALNGRVVYVVFDSDMYLKRDVEQALKALYAFLRSKQAIPSLVQWPEDYRQRKVGVDDFLVQGHSIEDLLAMVPPRGPLPSKPPRPERQSDATDEAYPYSDAYNALMLVRAHGQDLRYCAPWKSWLVWTGSHWQRDTTGTVLRLARQTVKALGAHMVGLEDTAAQALMAHIKSSLNTAKLEAAVRQAMTWPGISIDAECLDTDRWLLNVTNGTIDLRTGTCREHRREDLLTKCLTIPYECDATCPIWDAFLWRIMGASQGEDDPDMGCGTLENRRRADARATALIAYLQRIVGYSLTGSTREQCLFILHGPTKTGKSTFLSALRRLIGPYGKQADTESFMHKDRQEVRNDLADLAGARFVCAIESHEGRRLNENLIKQLTGGPDVIKARFLFQEHFEFPPQFKVFLGTNHLPKVSGDDTAIWERIKRVPFIVQIPKEDRKKDLDEQLMKELPGILAWAVRGCREWQELGELHEPEAVTDATDTYREDMDTLGAFLAECCVSLEAATVKAPILTKAYHDWCARENENPLSNTALIDSLENRGYQRERGHANQYYWHGLGLMDKGATQDEK